MVGSICAIALVLLYKSLHRPFPFCFLLHSGRYDPFFSLFSRTQRHVEHCPCFAQVAPGHSILVTGPNGSGKSSLFRLLGGLWPLTNGQIRKPGTNSGALLSSDIFYVPQKPYTTIGTLREQVDTSHTLAAARLPALAEQDCVYSMSAYWRRPNCLVCLCMSNRQNCSSFSWGKLPADSLLMQLGGAHYLATRHLSGCHASGA